MLNADVRSAQEMFEGMELKKRYTREELGL